MSERDAGRVGSELLAQCRSEQIEPPTESRQDRIVRSALHQAELALTARVAGRLSVEVREALDGLVGDESAGLEGGRDVLALIKASPGAVSLDSLLVEMDRLSKVRAVGLPAELFHDVAPSVVSGWRSRAVVESPSHLWTHPESLRWSLLASLVHQRDGEIVDSLVDLLIGTVHRIRARADKRVTKDLTMAFRRVTGRPASGLRARVAAIGVVEVTGQNGAVAILRGQKSRETSRSAPTSVAQTRRQQGQTGEREIVAIATIFRPLSLARNA